MKLAILKFFVYMMGILLIGSVLFLGYAIYQKINNPGWSPLPALTSSKPAVSAPSQVQYPARKAQCPNENKNFTLINTNRLALFSDSCDFIDIFDSNGRFINRIDLTKPILKIGKLK